MLGLGLALILSVTTAAHLPKPLTSLVGNSPVHALSTDTTADQCTWIEELNDASCGCYILNQSGSISPQLLSMCHTAFGTALDVLQPHCESFMNGGDVDTTALLKSSLSCVKKEVEGSIAAPSRVFKSKVSDVPALQVVDRKFPWKLIIKIVVTVALELIFKK